jgi:uncharacterized phage protein (TIGR02220 family)
MDWANERYVRVYTRDTVSWKLCDWRAHTVLLHLFRKVDRAGVLEVGGDGVIGLAAVLELPVEVVEPGIEQLTRSIGRRPTVLFTGSAYVIPNFIEAQEARQSDPQRAKESRARRRDLTSLESRNVTVPSQNVTQPSHDVTPSHTASQPVTPSLAVPSLGSMSGEPDVTDPALEFARKAVAEINRRSGSKYQPDSKSVLKLCRALVKNKHTVDELEQVIASKQSWVGDPKMGQYFRPATLLAADNFSAYLDDVRGGSLLAQGTQVLRIGATDDDEPDLSYAGFGAEFGP